MGTEDWVLKGTKLITNAKKLKIQSRVWNFKKYNIKEEKKKKKEEKSHKIIIYIYVYEVCF